MEAQFPLRRPPTCRQPSCGKPCTLSTVNETNANGHINRPYYFCTNGHPSIFSTFNDSQGIVEGNPQCLCGWTSRKSITNKEPRKYFYCCPVGNCGFNRGAGMVSATDGSAFGTPPPHYSGQRPEVDRQPQGFAMKHQGFMTEPAHRERYCCGCVVM
jgi:hypothetical protein